MTFGGGVLDQVTAMLQRRGRLTYRPLHLHFQLDDEPLEALAEVAQVLERLEPDTQRRYCIDASADDDPNTRFGCMAHAKSDRSCA